MKKLFCFILFLCFIAFPVKADTINFAIEYARNTSNVKIKGSVASGISAADVKLLVLKPGISVQKLSSGEISIKDAAVYMDETDLVGGAFEFETFNIKAGNPSGLYTVRVAADNAVIEKTLDFANLDQVFGFINNQDNLSAFMQAIDKYNDEVYNLPISKDTEFSKLDAGSKTDFWKRMLNREYDDFAGFRQAFSTEFTAYKLQRVSDVLAKISAAKTGGEVEKCIENYNDVYKLDLSNKSLFGSLNATSKLAVYGKMANKSYTSVEDVKDIMEMQTILHIIQLGPWGKVADIFENYNDILSLNLDSFNALSNANKDKVCKQMVGIGYNAPSDVQTGLNSAIAGLSSGGGGGGGGGRPSGNTSTISLPPVQPTQEIPSTTPQPTIFSDLNGAGWAKESIEALYNKGIVSGKGKGIFAPNDLVTRAEAVKMIVLAFAEIDSGADAEFTDIAKDNWAFAYAATAKKLGFAHGYEDGSFKAAERITRQDMATMLHRAAQTLNLQLNQNAQGIDFADDADIADYAADGVKALQQSGIISGMDDGTFRPLENASRAQAAKMIYSMILLIK